ncbi:putative aminodeoxychorismate lyase-like protein [Hapsidospora chrysogenum ATCC 11550]|uniref:Putative aminodeoxychorismate lyase-like protein n=1 Tax=Hapsidospora chrysogenum (strain ATCC 11550 / CBS 779.69 / DSM 880 / IAM 14645 / JCM 23072 / IMI 49137) TaxID=857340 RepID=A0A086SUP6_HAPC1|nr:putative aminodeoxychorismate lyase-like protein [Hapsidospora chrysogenum ATCC 11550]
MADDFLLCSTLRYDRQLTTARSQGLKHARWNFEHESPIYLLDYHRDRLLKAASHWGWKHAVESLQGPSGLESLSRGLQELIGTSQESPLRLRILVDRQGDIKYEKYDVPDVPLPQLFPRRLPSPGMESSAEEPPKQPEYVVVIDGTRTERSPHTHFKTTHRPAYDAACQRASMAPGELKEVLTVNAAGYVMEGTRTTPYLWRKGRWVTPPVSSEGFSLEHGSGGQDGVSRRWALECGIVEQEPVAANALVDGEECWLSNGARGFMFARIQL